MRFDTYMSEDRRLVILRLLESQDDFTLNDGLLLHGLDQLGHGVSRQTLHNDMVWLEALGLVNLSRLSPQIMRICLSEKGQEVCLGKQRIAGIRRLKAHEVRNDG